MKHKLTFPDNAPCAYPLFYRSYSRRTNGVRESWEDVINRVIPGFAKLGKLTPKETDLIRTAMVNHHTYPAGRLLWVMGTPWFERQENFLGGYNCTNLDANSWKTFGLLASMAMMGCGTGVILEQRNLEMLPVIRNTIEVTVDDRIGAKLPHDRQENTTVEHFDDAPTLITVGDSRQGWVDAYMALLCLSTAEIDSATGVSVHVNLTHVRPTGEFLSGFGGVANPIKLPGMFEAVARILNRAVGRRLNFVEASLVVDEMALTIVAGGIRHTAGMRQGSCDDEITKTAKDNLWQPGADGEWRIDPERDALRMANHTLVYHDRPSLETIKASVTKQYRSGEGAIQFAPEAIARANADILYRNGLKWLFIDRYCEDPAKARQFLADTAEEEFGVTLTEDELNHRFKRYGLNPCGEIVGSNFPCNLAEVNLNMIDPDDTEGQEKAFKAGAIQVCTLLHHTFQEECVAESRRLDPIVAVCPTGMFDFFVKGFGLPWLQWWADGRPADAPEADFFLDTEREYLSRWKEIVQDTIAAYCGKHGLRMPNRCTAVQPSGSKALLTGASSGWHPPKAARFIRRMTFRRGEPVAMACIDYGYNVIPALADQDEKGNLLEDPFDPRCTVWLVEIPVEVSWAVLPGADQIDISKFSALAQFDFYMQVQNYYTTHNTSATIELRENEIEPLAEAIHENIHGEGGYISAALLARFDDLQSFPRLPFEPIDQDTYDRLHAEVLARRKIDCFHEALAQYDDGLMDFNAGPAPCDSDKCLL